MSHKSSSSRRWLKEHFSDPYVKQAHQDGLRSRAVFKLDEIQQRDQLFRAGMTVIDLGAAPGSWSERLMQWVGKKGKVIALDILPMGPIAGVKFIQGDFQEGPCIQQLLQDIEQTKIDWVISDIAPNLSGIACVDQARSIGLAELVLDFALKVLRPPSGLLIKVFQGAGSQELLSQIRAHFSKVVIRKPKASRGRSREIYILAKMLSP